VHTQEGVTPAQRAQRTKGVFCYQIRTGHGGIAHGDWLGVMARLTIENKKVSKVAIKFVRHNSLNETYFCDPAG
jgi:hypothetical protein